MRLSKKIRLISKNINERDILFFRKDLKAFKDLITNMRQANPKASIADCIEGYNKTLEELIKKTNELRIGRVYRYIALDTLLNSRNCNSIIADANANLNLDEEGMEFNGCLKHDYISLVKTFYYSIYEHEYERLLDYQSKNPQDISVNNRIEELKEYAHKLNSGTLKATDINKFQREQKEFFEKLRRIEKVKIGKELGNNILRKIIFLKQIGALKNYQEEYNHTLEKLFMPSSFRIKDKNVFDTQLLNENGMNNYSIEELIALNAFWTNRLVKEVERRNEVIYVLENTNNFYAFREGEEFELIDEDIIYYLAEYRAIVPFITQFKFRGRERKQEKTVDEKSNIAALVFDIKEVFSDEDIKFFGYSELDQMSYNVLLLNNRSQILYDQKDIAIEEMISIIINCKGYKNAGICLEDDGNRFKEKSLIAIDLKGFNAPLMLHIDNDILAKRLNKIKGEAKIPVYRGIKDFIIENAQNGRKIAKTNILFKLNSEQRKDIAARAGVVGPRDTNGRYVTHISWMLNPKKDMPRLIYEPRRIIDIKTGEIQEQEDAERKK